MPERLHPGVYVEEVSGGVKPVEGVSTSTAAFVGEAARGIPAMAQFVTSFAEYEKAFGGHLPGDAGLLGHAVDGFFAAGGKRAYVVRVLPANAKKGQSDAIASRIGAAVSALQFVAKGAGLWSKNLRIVIGASSNFPDDAFRVDVQWSDNGAVRRLEAFDDVRMDASHEDYVVERMKTSRYVDAVDLFAVALDVAVPPTLIAAQLPSLKSKTVGAVTDKLSIPEGKKFTVSSWDVGQPDSVPTTTQFDFSKASVDAAITVSTPQPSNGYYDLTPIQIATVFAKYLPNIYKIPTTAPILTVSVELAVGTAPTVNLSPPVGTTYDLSGPQTLSLTINGAAPQSVSVTAGTLTAVTGDEIADAINAAGLGVSAVAGAGGAVTVTGAYNTAATPTLVVASSPTASRVTAAAGVTGVQGAAIPTEKFDSQRLSITEVITTTAPSVLRTLGFNTTSRGYAANSAANPLVRPVATATGSSIRVNGGTDGSGAITTADYIGDARDRTGLHALDTSDINIVAIPGKNDIAYISAGITYCDSRGDCFFVADGPGSSQRGVEVKADEARTFVDSLPMRSKNAAMFYPWIQVPDPTGIGRNPTRFVAPSGHVAGIFARTDITRGVWKAPAGIEASVPNSVGLQALLLDSDQDMLNPASLNCLRQFPGVGIVSWGTRTLSADPEWRYVPVRRMGLFLKESLRRGLKWAVFEPNDQELWGRIKINIEAFMMTLFRQGAFQGGTPDEAFSVQCDRSTNPQENVDAGIVTAKVAFAPLKPAEFVVIEISQKSLLVA